MPRIQALRIESNALRRMIGYTVIRANTAGSAAKQESSEATLLAPPLPVKDSRRILRKVHPHLDIDSVPIQRVHRYAIRRGFIRLALPGTLILGSVGFASSSFTPIYFFPLLWMLAFAWAILRYRGIGYALTDKEVIARSGVWTQTTWVVPLEKIQSVLLKQDPFQRRLGLATLSIETAGARSSSRAKIIDLDFVHSKALFRTIVREAAARDWTANPSDQEAAQNTVFE